MTTDEARLLLNGNRDDFGGNDPGNVVAQQLQHCG